MAVEAVGAGVEDAVGEPADMHVVARETGVAHLSERLDPVEGLRLLGPEAVRVFERAPVQFRVARGVDVCFPGDGREDREDFVRYGGKEAGGER